MIYRLVIILAAFTASAQVPMPVAMMHTNYFQLFGPSNNGLLYSEVVASTNPLPVEIQFNEPTNVDGVCLQYANRPGHWCDMVWLGKTNDYVYHGKPQPPTVVFLQVDSITMMQLTNPPAAAFFRLVKAPSFNLLPELESSTNLSDWNYYCGIFSGGETITMQRLY